MLSGQILEAEPLVRANAKKSKLRTDRHFVRFGRAVLQGETQVREKVGLCQISIDFWKVDRWRGRRCGLFKIRRKRLCLVARLNSYDVGHVGRVEQLGPKDREWKFSSGTKYLSYTWWNRALPMGASDHVIAGLIPSGTASDVAEIVGIAVNKLNRVVPRLFHRRH
ncbi:hypothetical protein D3C78_1468860 [compost metagenome]